MIIHIFKFASYLQLRVHFSFPKYGLTLFSYILMLLQDTNSSKQKCHTW